jgi:hypothetical protein
MALNLLDSTVSFNVALDNVAMKSRFHRLMSYIKPHLLILPISADYILLPLSSMQALLRVIPASHLDTDIEYGVGRYVAHKRRCLFHHTSHFKNTHLYIHISSADTLKSMVYRIPSAPFGLIKTTTSMQDLRTSL